MACNTEDNYYNLVPLENKCKTCGLKIPYLLRYNFTVLEAKGDPIAEINFKQEFKCQDCSEGMPKQSKMLVL
jgi:hypothetical protein